jgi:hypothetical protein
MVMAVFDDVHDLDDAEVIAPAVILPTVGSWHPPRLFECRRCWATTLTREARCGWREE